VNIAKPTLSTHGWWGALAVYTQLESRWSNPLQKLNRITRERHSRILPSWLIRGNFVAQSQHRPRDHGGLAGPIAQGSIKPLLLSPRWDQGLPLPTSLPLIPTLFDVRARPAATSNGDPQDGALPQTQRFTKLPFRTSSPLAPGSPSSGSRVISISG
jgi:hypothetical protein